MEMMELMVLNVVGEGKIALMFCVETFFKNWFS